jgi:hypothetical protein
MHPFLLPPQAIKVFLDGLPDMPTLSTSVAALSTALTTTIPALVTALKPTAIGAFTDSQSNRNTWLTAIGNAEGNAGTALFDTDPISIRQRSIDLNTAANTLRTGAQ